MERDMVQDVKKKIIEIRHKQRIALLISLVGIAVIFVGFLFGILLVNPTILGAIAQLGLFVFIASGCVWIYFSIEKSKTLKKLKTYLAMKDLKTRSGKRGDWELIQELLSD